MNVENGIVYIKKMFDRESEVGFCGYLVIIKVEDYGEF